MTRDELDQAIAAHLNPGTVMLAVEDWEAIIRPEPPEVSRAAEQLKPWIYRGLNVWIS